MSNKLLLVGGGGHCKSVLDSLLELNSFSDIGIIEKDNSDGHTVFNVPVIGCDDDLPELYQNGYHYAFVTVGSIGDAKLRIKIFNNLKKVGFEIPNIIDRTAVVSRFSCLGKGIYVGKKAVINAGSVIGNGSIINTGAIIEHDCNIGEFAHIASGTVLCGNVHIGANTHIGANSSIKQQLKIGSDSIIGMGSVVVKDMEKNIVAFGNPCRVVELR